MKQKSIPPYERSLGSCIDDLSEIKNFIQCQFDALNGLLQAHPDQSHHLTLNLFIFEKVDALYNKLENVKPQLLLLECCIEDINEIQKFIQCQFDALNGLLQAHPDQSHHLTLNLLIFRRVNALYKKLEDIIEMMKEKSS